jgi:hypothetical protein
MAAARKRMTRCAVPASCKVHGRHRPGKNGVVRETPKGQTFEKRRRKRPKCNTVIRDRDLRWELPLRSKETFYETLGQIIGLEVVKRTVEFSVGLWKMNVKTLWMSRPHPNGRRHSSAAYSYESDM